MSMLQLKPSQTVRVVQTLRLRERPWQTTIEGKIIATDSKPTGSWLARGRGGKLWLVRLKLEKADGEIIELILDEASVVTVLEDVSS